jgi:hypothetical protein
MKALAVITMAFFTTSCAMLLPGNQPTNLFVSRCEVALTKDAFVLRVSDTERGLVIEAVGPRRSFRSTVSGYAAEGIRERIAKFRLTQSDIEVMASRELRRPGPQGEDLLVLAPFDGATYYFEIGGSSELRKVSVSNSDADLHFQAPAEHAARLREVMDFVRFATQIARGEKKANKAPEPTPGSVTLRAPSRWPN